MPTSSVGETRTTRTPARPIALRNYDTVLAVVQGHIAAAMDMADALTQIDNLAWENRELEKINAKIAFQEEIIDKNRRLKTGAYEDFKSDFISRDEYKIYTARFDQQIAEATETIMSLKAGWLSSKSMKTFKSLPEEPWSASSNMSALMRTRRLRFV